MSLNDMAFIVLAGFTLAAAVGVVLTRNIIHSALFLVLTFLGVAGIYFQMDAGFLGLVQIMVYAGAISVLMIFAVMLVMQADVSRTNLFNPSVPTIMAGGYTGVLLAAALTGAVWFTKWPLQPVPSTDQGVERLAGLLLGTYVIPFEVAALLLLVAVFGAIILAKGEEV